MNKELKKRIIRRNAERRAAFPNLYDKRWVEKAADNGFEELIKDMEKIDPKLSELARKKEGYNVFAVIYYSSFESALNTFLRQCIDDTMTSVELHLDELQNITAKVNTN